MAAFFDWRLKEIAEADSAVCRAVVSALNPEAAATTFLIQPASDFLSEASAMARNVLGSYGPSQSELFKVLIDEYGYGVHRTKHSTLYRETLESRGLWPQVHAYWQFYLASALALTNYFHYVSKNHELFFRYLGALYYTEASLVHATRHQSDMLHAVWGDDVDTRYFDEHSHIDKHHGRMVIEKIIAPLVEQCGDAIVPDVVRGFEEFRLLQDMADADLIAQIARSDRRGRVPGGRARASGGRKPIDGGASVAGLPRARRRAFGHARSRGRRAVRRRRRRHRDRHGLRSIGRARPRRGDRDPEIPAARIRRDVSALHVPCFPDRRR